MTEREVDIILKALPVFWKNRGEKNMLENVYRFLLKHNELKEIDAWDITYDYVVKRMVHIWCKKTNSKEELKMLRFIEIFYNAQIETTPEIAETGKEDAEYLMRIFKYNPELAQKLLNYQKEHG